MDQIKFSNEIFQCRVCGSDNIGSVINLGRQPPANSLLNRCDDEEDSVNLEVVFCKACSTLQLKEEINPNELFTEYVWVTSTSQSARTYSEYFADQVVNRSTGAESTVIEIASNDGTFLKQFIDRNFKVVGVDPARNIAQKAIENGIPTVIDFFSDELAKEILKELPPEPKIVIARNVIPHVPDSASVIKGMKRLIAENGIGVIEFHDTGLVLNELQYDYIYHEHVFYYTLNTMKGVLEMHDLEIFDVFRSPISGGSHVVLFASKGLGRAIAPKVQEVMEQERETGLLSYERWQTFSEECREHRNKTKKLIQSFNGKVVGYGASARSSTLLNFCQFSEEDIKFIIDKNPLKQGKYTAGSRIPIVGFDSGVSNIGSGDLIFLLAWNFAEEIISELRAIGIKNQIVTPFPNSVSYHAS